MSDANKTNIVLVHGAFADGSSWSRVIPILAHAGYNVVAVQNPLTSTAEDVATTRRALEGMAGPTVAVGHSYGGFVISQAAKDLKNVKALVYIAAYAPDEGESIVDLNAKFPETPLGKTLRPDSAGFLAIDRAQFHTVFCPDVDETQALIMGATQKPIPGKSFGDKAGSAAWHDVPTFYQISENDQAIHPDMERMMAKRMNATAISLKSSHVAMVSHPKEVAALIEKAAQV